MIGLAVLIALIATSLVMLGLSASTVWGVVWAIVWVGMGTTIGVVAERRGWVAAARSGRTLQRSGVSFEVTMKPDIQLVAVVPIEEIIGEER